MAVWLGLGKGLGNGSDWEGGSCRDAMLASPGDQSQQTNEIPPLRPPSPASPYLYRRFIHMRTAFLAALLTILIPVASFAQDDLFGSTKEPVRKGLVIGINGSLDFPGSDMARRFGTSYRLGPSLMYKTLSNYMFGVKTDFIFGGTIKEDSLFSGVNDKEGNFINSDGLRIGVGLFERGYAIGLQGGKIFSLWGSNPNNGLLVLTGAGFVEHRIHIVDKDKTIPQIRDDYEKGYDRLTNGWYLEQFAGFNMFDKKGLLNFHIGLNFMAAFTQGRRDYLYDVRRKDDESRIDLLMGIRGGIYIPIFKKKSEELFFE